MPRNDVARKIRDILIRSEVPPGTWLREEEWARRVNLSRTPVREAFVQLHRDGLLENVARRGFRYPEFDPTELRDINNVVQCMEVMAIQSERFDAQRVARRLRRIGEVMRQSQDDAMRLMRLDTRWHANLAKGGKNAAASGVHRQMLNRVKRYDYAYWRRVPEMILSLDEHERIVDAIEADERELAAALIAIHWRESLRRLLQWMDSRPMLPH